MLVLLSVQAGACEPSAGRREAAIRRVGRAVSVRTRCVRRRCPAAAAHVPRADATGQGENSRAPGRVRRPQDDRVQMQVRAVGAAPREQPYVRAHPVVATRSRVQVRFFVSFF